MKTFFYIIPTIARSLGGGKKVTTFKLMLTLWFFALVKRFSQNDREYKIVGSFNKKELTFWLTSYEDISVLYEVYALKEYDWFPVVNPKYIVDLGANFGDTALYYHARFPEATVIAVEPSPVSYRRLQRHAQNIPQIICIQAAVGAVNGEIVLNLMPSSLGNSVMKRTGSGEQVKVPQITLQTLLEQNNLQKVDLIKFDIEGAEFSLFESLSPQNYAHAYIGEVHYDLVENKNADFDSIFSEFQINKKPGVKNREIILANFS